jgi:FkbM family methyltransferase
MIGHRKIYVREGKPGMFKPGQNVVTIRERKPMTVSSVVRAGPVTVQLISEGDRIAASLKDRGPFEPHSLALWVDLCRAGGVVLDIGAYTGVYSIAARLAGARCIAFEPMPANRARFIENCRINHVDEKCNSEAIGDECRPGMLHYNPIPFTSGASLVRKSGSEQKVNVLTVDSLNLQKVAAIKIDVERADAAVIAGARETLARCKPVILVEALDAELEAAVLAAAGDGYMLAETLDTRNRVLMPV